MRVPGSRVAVAAAVTLLAFALLVVLNGCPHNPSGSDETGGPVGKNLSPKGKTSGKEAAGGKAPSGEPIKIGALFSVTGTEAPLGEPEKKTAEMLEARINKTGVLGRPIKLIIKDTHTVEADAVVAAKDLIENEKVVAIIGPSGTPTTMAIKDQCQKAQVPLVSCAAGKTITSPIASYVFSVPQTNALAVEKIFQYLDKAKLTKIAVLSVDNPYGKDGLANIEKIAPQHKATLVAKESFSRDDRDLTAQLTRIKAASPAVLIVWATGPGPAIATKNAKTVGLKVPIIQSHGVANSAFLKLAGDAANGVQLPAGRLIVVDQIPSTDPQREVLQEFGKEFTDAYHAAPDTFAGHAYDALTVVVKAIEAAGSTDRAQVRDAIEKTHGFGGTAGIFNYSPTDHNGLTVDAFVWVKVEKGHWALVK